MLINILADCLHCDTWDEVKLWAIHWAHQWCLPLVALFFLTVSDFVSPLITVRFMKKKKKKCVWKHNPAFNPFKMHLFFFCRCAGSFKDKCSTETYRSQCSEKTQIEETRGSKSIVNKVCSKIRLRPPLHQFFCNRKEGWTPPSIFSSEFVLVWVKSTLPQEPGISLHSEGQGEKMTGPPQKHVCDHT